MKPRRCGSQKYASGRRRSRATIAAILFSSPSRRAFENGRLFGSAHTRSGDADAVIVRLKPDATAIDASSAIAAALQPEDIQHVARARVLLDLFHRADH